VHWRATAHTGRLQSKLFDISAQIETVIALNLRRSDYPSPPEEAAETAEVAVVAAASLAKHVLDQRQRVGLMVVARDQAVGSETLLRVPAGRGREQLAAILSVLGRVALGPTANLAAALDREKDKLNWGSLVVVITASVEEELLRVLLSMRTAGFDADVILVGRSPALPAEQAGLEAMGISAAWLRSEADISGLAL
jgi:uncharacterized protein (DUF58 family)